MLEHLLDEYLPLLVMLLGTFLTGMIIERRHYASILRRELATAGIHHLNSGKKLDPKARISQSRLVCGEAVISVEFFRWFVGLLHSLLGGTMREYETALDRARREAVLRMKESAKGASAIVNVRVEHTPISYGLSRFSGVEAIAWGTAIYLEEDRAG
jgi:uncharacterized protein YbjQ (UPF0145 family)